MTNQEILIKALEKAIGRGYKHAGMELALNSDVIGYTGEDWQKMIAERGYYLILFDHDFAKAIFGDDWWSVDPTGWHKQKDANPNEDQAWYLQAWQYHLQQMVIDPDPIAYLGRNI